MLRPLRSLYHFLAPTRTAMSAAASLSDLKTSPNREMPDPQTTVKPSGISAENAGIFTATKNMMGWQQNALDDYLSEFVAFAAAARLPVADLGAAYGFVSRQLLAVGATVITNDLLAEHLEELANTSSPSEKQRLTCMPGSLFDLNLTSDSLSGIVAARVLQFFTVPEIRQFFQLSYKWVAKGGRLCITNSSPYRGTSEEFQKEYEKKVRDGDEWPGITSTTSLDQNRQQRILLPLGGYRFDPVVLAREAERVGFRVIRCSYYACPFLPDEFRAPDRVRDGIGLIAEK